MDFIEEEDGAFVLFGEDARCFVDDLADSFDAYGCGVLAHEAAGGCFGDDFGECGFAGAGWAVEDDGGECVGVDHSAEEFAWAEDVGLPDDLIEGGWAYTGGERCDAREGFFAVPKVVE